MHDYTLFDSVDISKVDPRSTRSVVTTFKATLDSIKLRKEEEALKYFKMGCMMLNYEDNKPNNKLSIREYAQITGISSRKISYMKTIAKRFNRKETKFLSNYEELNASSWDSFIHKLYPPKKKYSKFSRKQQQKLDTLMAELKRNEYDQETYKTLKELRDDINKFIPLTESIFDKNIIKYNNCCGCGEPALPEGWEIKKDEQFPYIEYPLCPNCKKPNYKKVAKMYALYSIELEVAYDRIL